MYGGVNQINANTESKYFIDYTQSLLTRANLWGILTHLEIYVN